MTIRFASPAAREAALATGMAEGMNQSYDRLAQSLPRRGQREPGPSIVGAPPIVIRP